MALTFSHILIIINHSTTYTAFAWLPPEFHVNIANHTLLEVIIFPASWLITNQELEGHQLKYYTNMSIAFMWHRRLWLVLLFTPPASHLIRPYQRSMVSTWATNHPQGTTRLLMEHSFHSLTLIDSATQQSPLLLLLCQAASQPASQPVNHSNSTQSQHMKSHSSRDSVLFISIVVHW